MLLRSCMVAVATLASAALVGPAAAQSLSFKPQRIVLDAKSSTASLSLTNTGQQAETFRIELVDMVYQDDGKVVPATKTPAGHPSAKDFVRFSPSQVRLEPGETQTVRLLVRAPETLPDGEYRVHAVMRQLPNVTAVKPALNPNVVAGAIGIEQGVAIPVIIRRGQTTATGSIDAVKVVDAKAGTPGQLDLWLARQGNRSLYTNLVIKDKAGAVIFETKGVAVPVPNTKRRFLMPLTDKATPAALRSGTFTLEMIDHDSGAVIDRKPIR